MSTLRVTHLNLFGVVLLLSTLACRGSEPSADTTGSGDVETETGDQPIDLGPCQALMNCVNEVDPTLAEGIEENYGPDGTCYTIPGQTIETCWADCEDVLEGLAMVYPSNPWCNGAECVSDADCADDLDAPFCWPSNECGPACGNGRLDAGEQCDPGEANACTSACLFENHDCSPLDHAGCVEGSKCAIELGEFDYAYFTCVPGIAGPGGLQTACVAESDCSLAAPFCMLPPVQGCSDSCCVPYCYLGESDLAVASCPNGLSCVPVEESLLFGAAWQPGVELYGICL